MDVLLLNSDDGGGGHADRGRLSDELERSTMVGKEVV